ncbi:MAG: transposase [Sphaerochaetaceae bacterium]|nr:transposase [Sphaerochaetaceae bacterium]
MIINQKIRLILTKEDETILDSQSRMCNKLYNMLLERAINDKENGYELLKGRNLRNEVVRIKENHRYFYSVHSSPLKNVGLRIKKSFDNMNKIKNSYPKYKSFNRQWFSLYYDEPNKGIQIKNKSIRISLGSKLNDLGQKQRLHINAKLGEKINLRSMTGEIRNYRITKEYGMYYLVVCIKFEQAPIDLPKTNKVIAIDPNHTNFFVGIDNEGNSIEFGNLYQIKYFDNQIDKVKSKRDLCKRKSVKHITDYGKAYWTPSRRWSRLNKALTKLYYKRNVQIKTALYTIAHKLVREYDVIAIGDYIPDVSNVFDELTNKERHRIKRKMANQSVISKFRKILEQVCNNYNRVFMVVDEAYTTQECHHCKDRALKDPSIREYTCPICGTTYQRDINSAINIGTKAKILSSSDYVDLDLSKVTYTASYNLQKQAISYCH